MTHLPRATSASLRLAQRALLPLLLISPSLAQDQRPAVFQELGFDAALEAASAKGGLVILDAMTSWCGPCKQMDRTTWIDPRLVQWIDANAVAIQLDMDEHEALKTKLEVKAFPTIVLFKGGAEFDRLVGLRSADEMLAWLGASVEGKRAKDTVLERVAELRTSEDPGSTWGERAKLVEDLKWFSEYEEALREHLWLWSNLPESDANLRALRHRYRWGSQRYSMREIASAYPPARAAFRKVRDELTADVLSGTADDDRLRDWIELNFVVAEEESTVRWAEGIAVAGSEIARLRQLEHRLFALLIAHDSWRTAGLTLSDPVEQTRRQRDNLGAYDEDPPAAGRARTVPAIPIGGMRPARKIEADGGVGDAEAATPTEATAPAQDSPNARGAVQAKTLPAIPMTSGGQERKKAMPMIPMGGASAVDAEEDTATKVRRLLTDQFRVQASERYGALLAAERDPEARGVADLLLGELDDTRARAALLSAALRAQAMQRASGVHQVWLDWMAR